MSWGFCVGFPYSHGILAVSQSNVNWSHVWFVWPILSLICPYFKPSGMPGNAVAFQPHRRRLLGKFQFTFGVSNAIQPEISPLDHYH